MPLYLKLTFLLKELYQISHHLPKEYKYSLGSDIVNKNWELIDLYTTAQIGFVKDKKEIVSQLLICFEIFKLRVRFLSELRLISLGQASAINETVAEIGKMIGSWNKNI
jgi:hypothetical protein